MISSIIIDDEKSASSYLKQLILENFPEIQITGISDNTEDGITIIQQQKPDLLFLDIELPNQSGIEMLRMFDNIDFEIIFITAHSNYAIEAFDFCAIGYIIKPPTLENLTVAIENAKNRIKLKKFKERTSQLFNNLDHPTNQNNSICISSMNEMTFVEIKDIIRCEGISKATKIFLKNKKKPLFSSYSIGRFVKLLKPYGFIITHKSHIVNKRYITSYLKDGNILLKNNDKIPVAKRRRQKMMDILHG